tara:strand:- start:1637 stop:2665 length:1029 start_codon:yes stop_codon:yes gene_type:complete
MRILIDIGHPAHVHLFRNFIKVMEKKGNKILVTIREKENVEELLNYYKIHYISLGKNKKTMLEKIGTLYSYSKKLYYIARDFNPNIFLSHGSMYAAHVSRLLGKSHISMEDTEHSSEQINLYKPFTDVILTSNSFTKNLGQKQIRYNGYHELAYLHPNYFKSDSSILDFLGIQKDEKFVIIRFISWSASHDFGHTGLSLEMKRKIVRELSKYARIVITSEDPLPRDLEKYRSTIPPERMHDALYYASLYAGEGATMASEAACLGTPFVTFVSSHKIGYLIEQEEKYKLGFSCSELKDIISTSINILDGSINPNIWVERRRSMINSKIDVTKFLVSKVENWKA